MAPQILEGREVLVSRLKTQLGTLVHSAEIAAQNNLSSSHVVAETTMLGLLNRIYGWELVNANAIRKNFPGIDLIDEKRNLAIQVTATRTAKKVRHTLEEVGKSGVRYDELIVLVLTNMKPTDDMCSCTVPTYSGPMKIWNIPDVFGDAMGLDPFKLDELVRFMEAEVGAIRERVKELPHLDLPPATALPATGFVGREEELAEIRSRFARGDRMVVLTGLGGMGKTELAVRFGQDYPGLVYFVRFDTNFTRTLAHMVHGIRPKLVEAELRLEESILIRKVQLLLERSSPDDLLIIDNADSDTGALADLLNDPGYKLIQDLPLRLLITTRSDAPRSIPVAPMPEGPLCRIFQNHGAELTLPEMQALIRAVNGHTLTIDLMARTLNGRGWRKVTAEMMLSALRDNTLAHRKYRKIATDYNQSTDQAQIYEHLSAVFDISGMPEVSRQVMRCAALLPESGMEGECFGMSLPEPEQDALDDLLERGWLEMKHGLLTIHPIIRLVCHTELKPTGPDCEAFLVCLWTRYDPTQYCPDQYSQMAELFTLAHDRLGESHCRWLNYSGILLNALDQYQQLHDLYHPRLPALEAALPPNSTDLATAYNYYGIALCELGRYSDALAYGKKALTIQQAELPADSVELAYSYNNVGSAQGTLGDFRTALENQLKALEILQNVLPSDHPDLIKSCNHVGSTYNDLGLHHQALEYIQMALDICKRALSLEHPLLASVYHSAGLTHSRLGHYQQALEYRQLALDIRQAVLPSEHPDLAFSYHSVGQSYGELGRHHDALEYHQKALTIREKVLPPYHPDLALSHNHVGNSYNALSKHHHALKCHLKALTIQDKALPPEHPNLAATYNDVGYTFTYLCDYPKALEYHQKTLDISIKALPPEHPNLATAYNNLGHIYGNLNNHRKELEYHQKALAIREKALPPDHPDLAQSYNNLGCTYGNLGDHRKELEYKQKALVIREKALPPDHPDLALSCNNIAWTYHELGDFPSAARFMGRAAEIIGRSSLPKNHPDRINYPKWAAEFEKKAEFQRRLLNPPPGLPPFPFPKK